MDRNLGDNVAWYADVQDNSFGPITALTALQDRTNTWTNLPEMTINTFDYDDSRDDVTLGNNKSFTTYTRLPKYSEIYAVNNSDTLTNTPWLYENLYTTGDDTTDSNGDNKSGYWTSTANSSYSFRARHADYYGYVAVTDIVDGNYGGVRPVIELSK